MIDVLIYAYWNWRRRVTGKRIYERMIGLRGLGNRIYSWDKQENKS